MKNISLTSELEFETEDLPAGNISGNDDKINEADWSYMNSKWGTKDSIADLNEDGIVNTLDWSFMNKNWSGR